MTLRPSQGGEVHAVAPAVEAELDAVVDEAFAVHALAGPAGAQHVGRALFEDAGALALLDVVAVARLQQYAVDSGLVQQAGEQQPRRAAADDADGGAHQLPPDVS
jgi:hypothetical protein